MLPILFLSAQSSLWNTWSLWNISKGPEWFWEDLRTLESLSLLLSLTSLLNTGNTVFVITTGIKVILTRQLKNWIYFLAIITVVIIILSKQLTPFNISRSRGQIPEHLTITSQSSTSKRMSIMLRLVVVQCHHKKWMTYFRSTKCVTGSS